MIKELGLKVKAGEITWQEATDIYNKENGANLSREAFRGRFRNLKINGSENDRTKKPLKDEYEEIHANGLREIQRQIFFDYDEEKTPENVLKKLGYPPENWEMVKCRFGTWEVAIRDEEENRLCTTVRLEIKPRQADLTIEEVLQANKELLKEGVKPLKYKPKKEVGGLDPDKMIELPPFEGHIGKLSHTFDTGENYDYKIAKDRFYQTIENVVEWQLREKADTLLLGIGGDFFNSDTVQHTTTAGTLQDNDLRWKKMFLVGLKMYSEALRTLRERFNNIVIKYVPGNHDKMASFYLYVSLMQLFSSDEKINFSENYQATQCFVWGKCAIFFNHGDKNFKRTIKSIATEFPKEWGNSTHRELHLGHLHKEMMVDDDSGLVTRRIPAPTGTDEWHYENRYIREPKYQMFVWDKNKGMLNSPYVTFDKKKQLTRK